MSEPKTRSGPGGAADAREAPVGLDDLDVFVRVVETESMSAAARLLGVPKSTVSRAVSRLEDAMRVRLLQRTSRSLSPTDAGRALFAEAQPHVLALRAAKNVVSALAEAPRGSIKVTAPTDLASDFLAEVFTRFVQRYPDVTVEMYPTARTVDLVAEGFDLAIRAGTLRDSSLVARKVADSNLGLFAAPEYLARRGTPRSADELAEHDCVLFRPQRGRARLTLETDGGRAEKVQLDVTGHIGGDDFGFLRAAMLAGAGVGLLPCFLACNATREGRLVRVLPHLSSPGGAFYLVHASGRHVPRKIALLRDFLVEAFRTLPGP